MALMMARIVRNPGSGGKPIRFFHRLQFSLRWTVPLLCSLFLWLAGPGPAQAQMSESELTQLYLDIVEEAVAVFEPLWVDDSSRIPNSGFFDFRKYDDWTPTYKGYAGIITIPGNGLVDLCYAILLTETEKTHFTPKKIPRTVLLDHAIKSIRWCCLTSVYVKNPYPYIYEDTAPQFLEGRFWRRELGYRADEVGFLTLAAAKLWNELDAETRDLVEAVMIGGAPKERLVRTWEPPQGGNQDQVKQDLSSTIGAAFLFPQRPDSKRYWDIVALNGLDMVSTIHDFARQTVVEGKPVCAWAKGWNLYPDYSSDHHGWAQIWYGCDMLFEGYWYVDFLSRLYRRQMPETFTYPGNGFEGILERVKILCLPEGEPASVHGMEYDSYYSSGLLGYLYGAVIKKDPVAAALEERAAHLLWKNSRAIPLYDYHRNNWAKAALAYLAHKYGGGRAEPAEFKKAWKALEGTFFHRWWQNLWHRDDRKLASFSWGTISSSGDHFGGTGSGVCGFVIPARLKDVNPEPLLYLHPFSITGKYEVTDSQGNKIRGPLPADFFRFSRDETHFQTAGRTTSGPVEQRCAFFSFGKGPVIFFNLFKAKEKAKLDWSGVPFYFYVRPGMTSSRAYFDASGSRPLEKPHQGHSSWWCVHDLLGAIFIGGTDEVEIRRTVGRNWARTDAYKDKCDTIFTSPLRGVQLEPGDTAGNMAVVVFPEKVHASVEQAARSSGSFSLDLPQGWKGLVVPELEGSNPVRHLAVANLDGHVHVTSLTLGFPEGAPILSVASFVQGKKATLPLDLEPLATFAESITAYAENLGDVFLEVRRLSLGHYRIRPEPGQKARVRLRFHRVPERLQIVDRQGRFLGEIEPSRRAESQDFVVEAEREIVVINRAEVESDDIGPAVDIEEIEVREDGRVTLWVEAKDQSGIRRVEFFLDGAQVAHLTSEPWIWTGWPGKGYHTFYVRAWDNSPLSNERTSTARTIEVKLPERVN